MINLKIGKIYSGEEVNEIEEQNANYDITENCFFKLIEIDKRELYEKNLITKEDWEKDEDNYDEWHTKQIDWMIEQVENNKYLPPIVVDKDGYLQDGTHRLSAYNEINSIQKIIVFKEVESNE